MTTLKRYEQRFWYALFDRMEPILDNNERPTSRSRVIYHEPVEFWGTISTAKGEAETQQFGEKLDYDRVIKTSDTDIPVDETSVLWVDNSPYDENGNRTDAAYDHIVKSAPKSPNFVSVAIKKVQING